MTPKAAITDALDALGQTPDDIRGTLRTGGITGKLSGIGQLADACPIYNYLIRQFPDVKYVGNQHAYLYGPFKIGIRRIPLTPAVRDFIWRFDLGNYPELVAK